MPILALEYNGQRQRVPFERRVTMGRASSNDLIVDHPAISRTHAIFEQLEGAFVVTDMGSKNGVYLEDIRIVGRHTLNDGETLTIGPAVVTFYTHDRPEPPEPTPEPPEQEPPQQPITALADGIILNCECGMRLWVPREMIGGRGQCPKCKRPVELIDPHAAPRHTCSICQWEIAADQLEHVCSNCGLHFHAECWDENRGCSAYGCSQVGSLDHDAHATPVHPPATAIEEEVGHPPPLEATARFPWEFALLGASAIAAVFGLLLFGAVSIIVGVAAVIYFRRNYHMARKSVMYITISICVIGLFAGLVASQVFWLGRQLDSIFSR